MNETLKKVNEEYASRVQVINSTPEETKRRVKGNYVKTRICDINEFTGNVEIDAQVFKSDERITRKGKQIVTLLIPMFFISITRAEDLANAMEARGYVIGERRTNVDELKFRLKDLISFIVVLSILGFTIYLQVAK